MKKKRLVSLLLMTLMAFALTSSAFADVNLGSDDGTGWGYGTDDNIWAVFTESNAKIYSAEGLRVTVYDGESNTKVYNTVDITGNANISAVSDFRYFADTTASGYELIPKTSWLSSSYIGATYTNTSAAAKYNNVVAARIKYEGYNNNCKYIAELADLTIISEDNSVNLEKIKAAIGAENFLRNICDLIPSLQYEDFAAGKYRIALSITRRDKFLWQIIKQNAVSGIRF